MPSSNWAHLSKAHKHTVAIDIAHDHRRAVERNKNVADGVQFEVKDSKTLNQLDMNLQADATLNTVAAWESRLALRRSVPVREALHKWWSVVLKTIGDRFDDGEVPFLDEPTFMRLCKMMYKVIDNTATEDELEEAAVSDWAQDSRDGQMTRELFMNSLFELADVNTPKVSAADYSSFLTALLKKSLPKGRKAFWIDGAKSRKRLMKLRSAAHAQGLMGLMAAEAEANKLRRKEEARRRAEEEAARLAALEEQRRLAAEEEARRRAEEEARRAAALEERRRREAEEKARLEAEEKARRAAEAKAKREADEAARKEAEAAAKVKREAKEAAAKAQAEEAAAVTREKMELEKEAKKAAELEKQQQQAAEKAAAKVRVGSWRVDCLLAAC